MENKGNDRNRAKLSRNPNTSINKNTHTVTIMKTTMTNIGTIKREILIIERIATMKKNIIRKIRITNNKKLRELQIATIQKEAFKSSPLIQK